MRISLHPERGSARVITVLSAVLRLLLVLALLPAMLGAVRPQAWVLASQTRLLLATAGVEHRAVPVQERIERARRDTAELRDRTEKRSPGAGPPPAGAGHALSAAFPTSLRQAVVHRPQLQQSSPPPAPAQDQRITIRRCRASAHVPHVGDDDPAAADLIG